MNKKIYGFLLGAILTLSLASGAFASMPMGQPGFRSFDSGVLIGAEVRNPQGEFVGLIYQLRVDTGGHAFAILNHGPDEYYGDGGGYTPVPIEAFQITEPMSGHLKVVLNSDEKRLEAAPAFDPLKDGDRGYEADIYQYYGIRPYWTAEDECSWE